MYSVLVDSLKRLYENNKITENKVDEMCDKGTISENDKKYILGKE